MKIKVKEKKKNKFKNIFSYFCKTSAKFFLNYEHNTNQYSFEPTTYLSSISKRLKNKAIGHLCRLCSASNREGSQCRMHSTCCPFHKRGRRSPCLPVFGIWLLTQHGGEWAFSCHPYWGRTAQRWLWNPFTAVETRASLLSILFLSDTMDDTNFRCGRIFKFTNF